MIVEVDMKKVTRFLFSIFLYILAGIVALLLLPLSLSLLLYMWIVDTDDDPHTRQPRAYELGVLFFGIGALAFWAFWVLPYLIGVIAR
jgi:hypothetical protein